METFSDTEQFSLQDLRAISEGDADIEIAAIESFLESTPEELGKLRTALAQNNAKDSSIYSHSIKGASKYVGANRLTKISSLLEDLCKDSKLDQVRTFIPLLDKEIKEVGELLSKYKATL
eukprot:TRINITY_DN10405_c0_g1_i1.p1 TRINITY_DN10405_c0_g1~~TRINITY_DN10405_c0_g1_i1.p1  ORF type:complete len:120 (+),score=16.60 TRINITY_DN10405_c0_g1_i1:20-379(+)